MTQTPTHTPIAIPVHRIGAGQAFHFNIQPFVNAPVEHPIKLIAPLLDWLTMSPSGLVSGISPHTHVLLQFWITLEVGQGHDAVCTGFLLQVVPLQTPTMVIPRIPIPRLHPIDPNTPHTHDLLDYIFHYFDAYAKDEWVKLLKEEANKRAMVLSDPIKPHEFKELIIDINPLAEKQLRDKNQALQALTLAELRADEIINLFRQGSQPMGATPIVIFNYLAAPDRHNYSRIKNVLDFAADELIELLERNQMAYQLKRTPKPH